jgi:hypothetical protein
VAVLLVARAFRVDGDTWWHLLVGERILRTHSWPTSDIYSFTAPGADWIAYEWMGEVVIALASRLGGLTGLMGLLLAATASMMLLLYCYAYLRSRNSKAAFVATLLVLPLAGVWFSLHPQLLGYNLLVVTLICLERFRQGHRKSLWLLPAVFCLWINTHGTFVFGFVALGIYWASGLVEFRAGSLVAERWKAAQRLQLGLVSLLSVLALCVTPYGTRLAAYPAQMMVFQQEVTAHMTSWQPIPFNVWHGELFLVYVLLFIVALAALELRLRLEELALFLFAVFMTARHGRTLPLFALLFAPLLARLLARWLPPYEPAKDLYALNALLIALLVLVLAKSFPARRDLERAVAAAYPRQGVEYLRQHPQPDPMFNDLGWGGYMLYSLGPEHRVFIDGRADIYQYGGVLSDYLHITQLDPETPRLLRKYNLQSCFIPPESPLATFLSALPEWKRIYEDQQSVLFVRRERPRGVNLAQVP